jgi:hypothetical protein
LFSQKEKEKNDNQLSCLITSIKDSSTRNKQIPDEDRETYKQCKNVKKKTKK